MNYLNRSKWGVVMILLPALMVIGLLAGVFIDGTSFELVYVLTISVLMVTAWLYGYLWIFSKRNQLSVTETVLLFVFVSLFTVLASQFLYWRGWKELR